MEQELQRRGLEISGLHRQIEGFQGVAAVLVLVCRACVLSGSRACVPCLCAVLVCCHLGCHLGWWVYVCCLQPAITIKYSLLVKYILAGGDI
jgi:hypothetical protein